MKTNSIFHRRKGLRPTSQRLFFKLLLWLTILVPLATAHAQDFAWATRAGGSSSDDHGNSVAVDGSGNVYTTGFFQGTADFGSTTLTAAGSSTRDAFVAKQNAAGDFQWAFGMGGADTPDEAFSIAVDGSGNSYIMGYFRGTATFGDFTITASGTQDEIFVAKLNSSGTIVWAKRLGSTFNNRGLSMAVDGIGNVFVTGFFTGAVDFSSTITLEAAGQTDVFVAKLDPTNGEAVWAVKLGGTGFDEGRGIAVDASHVYVTGSFQGTADFNPGAVTSNLVSEGGRDIFVTKLTALSGSLVWAKAMGGTGTDEGASVAVDGAGNVVTTGYFEGDADFDPGANEVILSSAGISGSDIFISKLNSSGDFVWAKDLGSNGNDEGTAIALDGSNNIYVTGYFSNTVDFDPGTGTRNLTSAGSEDVFIAKLTSAGLLTYAGRIGASGRDIGNAIAVSSGGNIHVTGQFGGTVDFDPGPGTTLLTSGSPTPSSGSGTSQDIFVVKLTACINPTAYAVTGGGAFCAGGTGLAVGLADTESGVNYQLKLDGSDLGSPVAGTGSVISFGIQAAAGTYTVEETSSGGGCTTTTTNSVTVTVEPIPAASIEGNGGAVCSGDDASFTVSGTDGATLTYTLSGQSGNQTLALDGTNQTITANGATADATLTLVSVEKNTCSANLSETSTVTVNPLPTATFSGGGVVCAGEDLPDLSIDLTGTAPFTFAYTDGTTSTTVTGTSDNPYMIANAPAGTYSVSTLSDANGCSAASQTSSTTVTIDPLPTSYNVTGSGSYCAGGAGVAIGLDGSESGINYQLKRDGNTVGSPLPGTGNALNLGNQTTAGSYTVTATNITTSCTVDMTSSATVTIDPLPTVNAGSDQSVILGYGGDDSNCTDLTATANGGTGSYAFAWDNGAGSTATVNVCPEVTTTYEVTLEDDKGCTATDEVTVEVQDVRCGPGNKYVTVCYYGVTQCVREKIARRYLKLGATLGACGSGVAARIGTLETTQLPLQLSLKAFPNPVQDAVTVEVLSPTAGAGTFEVIDMQGRARQSRKQVLSEGRNEVLFRLGSLPTGIYMIRGINSLNQQGVVRVKKE